jgi:MFS family permease
MAKTKLMAVNTPRKPLLLSRRFAPLYVLFEAGTFNDNALKNALIALITYVALINPAFEFLPGLPEALKVPVASLIFTGPFLVFCAIAGQVADKVDRGIIFRWIKRAEVGIMLLAGLGFLLQNVTILAIALGLMGTQSAFFAPTKNAVMPQWLDSDELIRGNGLLSGTQFAVLLLGTIVGTALAVTQPLILAGLLFVLAIIGWIAAEACPPAAPPNPDLKVDYNPITAIWSVLKKIFEHPEVLRPWLGIAWFYGLSTIFLTAFPNFIARVMGYDPNVFMLIMASSTIAIFFGSMLTMAIGNMKIWGPEAIRLVALGITGITISSALIYFLPEPVFDGETGTGSVSAFISNPKTMPFMAAVMACSMFNGIFVVPLQAMAQRRAHPRIRAQLMSAGSVLYNFSVNALTFGLIGLALMNMPPKAPFAMIVIGSACVMAYALYRVTVLERETKEFQGHN